MEEAEAVMKIIDRWWFELDIFKKRPDASPSSTSGSDPGQQSIAENENPCINLSRTPSILVRSMSDQTSIIPTSFQSSSLSPDPVLRTTPIHSTIYEEEAITEEGGGGGFKWNNPRSSELSRRKKGRMGGRAKRRALSKSLSQLEFEELKGFMDLGFVFSEEDTVDSSLVSILPGLQKLGKRINDGEEDDEDGDHHQEPVDEIASVGESAVTARPYLSEAWEWWEEKRKEDPLMNWKVPALGNQTDMRESLKWWAHTVASTVR